MNHRDCCNASLDHALQDNVFLPKKFTKYVYHVGNGKELTSIVHNSLVPGGFSTKTGRYASFFTVVNPMNDEQGLRETFCVLSKERIAPSKNTWKPLQDGYIGAICCTVKEDCKFPKQGPMQLFSIEKATCTKTGEQLYQRESERPRVSLKVNS